MRKPSASATMGQRCGEDDRISHLPRQVPTGTSPSIMPVAAYGRLTAAALPVHNSAEGSSTLRRTWRASGESSSGRFGASSSGVAPLSPAEVVSARAAETWRTVVCRPTSDVTSLPLRLRTGEVIGKELILTTTSPAPSSQASSSSLPADLKPLTALAALMEILGPVFPSLSFLMRVI